MVLALAGPLALSARRRLRRQRRSPPASPRPVAPLPRGDLPIIGDPIRDLTIWWSNRLTDANRAGLDSLRGRALTPIDPLADDVIKTLYGKILLITIPLLTLGGMILGYLIMTSRTTGESAYTARAVTPRFVVGATLSVLGIFLVSVLAQFVTATDTAMVGVSIPGNAVGGPDAWPAAGGVFQVLQHGGFDPHIGEGPNNWNDGAWLSAGLLAAILLTLVQMVNAVLSAVERLLVLVGPLCLAAYALPATQRMTNVWLKVLSRSWSCASRGRSSSSCSASRRSGTSAPRGPADRRRHECPARVVDRRRGPDVRAAAGPAAGRDGWPGPLRTET